MVLAVAVAGRLRRYAASLHPSRMSSAAAASVISLSSAGCNELLPAATPLFDALQLPLETESLFVCFLLRGCAGDRLGQRHV
jgi:hypothetical protein